MMIRTLTHGSGFTPLGIASAIGGILGIGVDIAAAVGGAILDAIFGLFGALTQLIADTIGPKIASAYLSTVLYTPVPKRSGQPALVQQPTNMAPWNAAYSSYYDFLIAGFFIMLLLYVMMNFLGSIPYTEVTHTEEIRGGILKYVIFGVFGWPAMAFIAHLVKATITLVAPSQAKANALISQLVGAMAAAAASPFAVLTAGLSFIDIVVFIIVIALYTARVFMITGVPMFAPLFMAGYFMNVPIIKGLSKAAFSVWVKLLVAPVFVAMVLRVGAEFLLVKQGSNWVLNTQSNLAVNQIAYFGVALLIPVAAILALVFVLLASTPSSITTPVAIGAAKASGTSARDVIGEDRWDKVSSKENWGQAAKTSMKSAAHPIRSTKNAGGRAKDGISEKVTSGLDWGKRQYEGAASEATDIKSTWGYGKDRGVAAVKRTAASPRGAMKDISKGALPGADRIGPPLDDADLGESHSQTYPDKDVEALSDSQQIRAFNGNFEELQQSDASLSERQTQQKLGRMADLAAASSQPTGLALDKLHDQFDDAGEAVHAAVGRHSKTFSKDQLDALYADTDRLYANGDGQESRSGKIDGRPVDLPSYIGGAQEPSVDDLPSLSLTDINEMDQSERQRHLSSHFEALSGANPANAEQALGQAGDLIALSEGDTGELLGELHEEVDGATEQVDVVLGLNSEALDQQALFTQSYGADSHSEADQSLTIDDFLDTFGIPDLDPVSARDLADGDSSRALDAFAYYADDIRGEDLHDESTQETLGTIGDALVQSNLDTGTGMELLYSAFDESNDEIDRVASNASDQLPAASELALLRKSENAGTGGPPEDHSPAVIQHGGAVTHDEDTGEVTVGLGLSGPTDVAGAAMKAIAAGPADDTGATHAPEDVETGAASQVGAALFPAGASADPETVGRRILSHIDPEAIEIDGSQIRINLTGLHDAQANRQGGEGPRHESVPDRPSENGLRGRTASGRVPWTSTGGADAGLADDRGPTSTDSSTVEAAVTDSTAPPSSTSDSSHPAETGSGDHPSETPSSQEGGDSSRDASSPEGGSNDVAGPFEALSDTGSSLPDDSSGTSDADAVDNPDNTPSGEHQGTSGDLSSTGPTGDAAADEEAQPSAERSPSTGTDSDSSEERPIPDFVTDPDGGQGADWDRRIDGSPENQNGDSPSESPPSTQTPVRSDPTPPESPEPDESTDPPGPPEPDESADPPEPPEPDESADPPEPDSTSSESPAPDPTVDSANGSQLSSGEQSDSADTSGGGAEAEPDGNSQSTGEGASEDGSNEFPGKWFQGIENGSGSGSPDTGSSSDGSPRVDTDPSRTNGDTLADDPDHGSSGDDQVTDSTSSSDSGEETDDNAQSE